MKIKNVASAATALTAVLVLTACGGADTSGTATSPAPVAPTSAAAPGAQVSAEHNDADIAFAQGMIPHHRQAVEMSALATGRAGSDEVRRLAAAIEQAQAPEIAQMRGFLAAWGAPEPGGMGHGGMGHGGMAGMMTGDQMRRLEQSTGAAFDRMFLEMMIAHHEGAVQMAQTELADGVDPQARALAQEIIDAQQSEITVMRRLLG